MIHEYALEPKLVSTWVDSEFCSLIISQFGFGTGRLISSYPNSQEWKRYIYKSYDESQPEPVSDKDKAHREHQKKKLEVLANQLCDPLIKRKNVRWDTNKGWIDNVCTEHMRRPFKAVITYKLANEDQGVIPFNSLFNSDLWHAPSVCIIKRNAQSIDAVSALLKNCKRVVFIDPYFNPKEERYRDSYKEFIRRVVCMRDDINEVSVEFLTCLGKQDREKKRKLNLKKICEKYLPSITPRGLKVTIENIQEKDDGEKIHNRYILTDIGGVIFPVGLDIKPTSESSLLYEHDIKNWQSFFSKLVRDNNVDIPKFSQKLWSLFSAKTQKIVKKLSLTGTQYSGEEIYNIIDELNQIFKRKILYQVEYFSGIKFTDEIQVLLNRRQNDLSTEDVQRLNRFLFEKAYPDYVVKNTYHTDDITLLDRTSYIKRWSQYAGVNLAFDLVEEPIVITGRSR